MKYLYICEKCGKTFTDSNEAWQCEYSHVDPEMFSNWELEEGTTLNPYVYTSGDPIASVVYLRVHVYNEHGCYKYDDNGRPIYEVYPFKRMKQDSTSADLVASMRNRWIADHTTTEEEEG